VRLVHDRQGPVQSKEIAEGKFDLPLALPLFDSLQPRRIRRHSRKMRLKIFVMPIDFAALGVGHAQSLHRGNQHTGAGL
jgi:hypothetical protein